jgi:hypothetical protein
MVATAASAIKVFLMASPFSLGKSDWGIGQRNKHSVVLRVFTSRLNVQ